MCQSESLDGILDVVYGRNYHASYHPYKAIPFETCNSSRDFLIGLESSNVEEAQIKIAWSHGQ